MRYTVLIIIAIVAYFIYRAMRSPKETNEEVKEYTPEEADRLELVVSLKLSDSRDKENSATLSRQVAGWKENYTRLAERYKHDNLKLAQVIKDYIDYLDIASASISVFEVLEFSSPKQLELLYKEKNVNDIKLQEIIRRYKTLLGDEYIDPYK